MQDAVSERPSATRRRFRPGLDVSQRDQVGHLVLIGEGGALDDRLTLSHDPAGGQRWAAASCQTGSWLCTMVSGRPVFCPTPSPRESQVLVGL